MTGGLLFYSSAVRRNIMNAKRCTIYSNAFFVAFAILFVAWINNIWISLQWHQNASASYNFKGFIGIFDKLSVDMSTISIFIPMLGMWLVARGWRKIADNERSSLNDFSPFYYGYGSKTVALGLISTVWGLIMIGFYKDTASLKINDLFACLHTALFSTLMALIWVYIFVPKIKNWMKKSDIALNNPLIEVDSVMGQISLLGIACRETSTIINDSMTNFSTLSIEIGKISVALADALSNLRDFKEKIGIDVFQVIKNLTEQNGKAVTSIQEILVQHGKILSTQKQVLDTLLTTEQKRANEFEAKLNEMEKRWQADRLAKNTARAKIQAVKECLNGTVIDETEVCNREYNIQS